MSKSKPDSCIFIHESPEEIKKKLQKAFCPPKIVQGNPVMEICQMIIFPRMGALEVSRPEKYGGNITFKEYNDLKKIYQTGKLHPSDLKSGVAKSLAEYLSPVREYYKKNPKPLDASKSLVITR
jgi:tyrosyl-tRNA synthetase